MKAAAWWNGVVSLLILYLGWDLLTAIWQHNKEDIVAFAFFIFIAFIAWGATGAAATLEK